MTSPIERKPNNDKTIMPLRGEGNQFKRWPNLPFNLNKANSRIDLNRDFYV